MEHCDASTFGSERGGGGGGGGWQHFKQNGCWFSPPIVLFIYFCKNYKIIKQNKIKFIF